MSRCFLVGKEGVEEAVIGWDMPLKTFFATVVHKDSELPLVFEGAAPCEYSSPNALVDAVEKWVQPFNKKWLIEQLNKDMLNNSARFYSIMESNHPTHLKFG